LVGLGEGGGGGGGWMDRFEVALNDDLPPTDRLGLDCRRGREEKETKGETNADNSSNDSRAPAPAARSSIINGHGCCCFSAATAHCILHHHPAAHLHICTSAHLHIPPAPGYFILIFGEFGAVQYIQYMYILDISRIPYHVLPIRRGCS